MAFGGALLPDAKAIFPPAKGSCTSAQAEEKAECARGVTLADLTIKNGHAVADAQVDKWGSNCVRQPRTVAEVAALHLRAKTPGP